MRKLSFILSAAALLAVPAPNAFAVEFRTSGQIIAGAFASNSMLGDLHNFQNHQTVLNTVSPDPYDLDVYSSANLDYSPRRYMFKLRYGLSLDFIASEQLGEHIGFKCEDNEFAVAGFNRDWEDAVYVSNLYPDWQIPNTPVSVRLDRWTQTIASFTVTTELLSTDFPRDGVHISIKINDYARINAQWWSLGDNRHSSPAWGVGNGFSLEPRGVDFNLDPDGQTYDPGPFQGRDRHNLFDRHGWYLSGRISCHTAWVTWITNSHLTI